MYKKTQKLIATIVLLFSLVHLAQAQVPTQPKDIAPLLIGEMVPNVSLKNIDGKEVNFKSIYEAKKTVLIVYRGGWCPYCNRHLSEMYEIESDIKKLGYQVVAVSPDDFKGLQETVKKGELSYQLLSDSKGTFMKELGIAYTAPEKYSKMLLKSSGGDNANLLPVPSVFVINEKGEIEFEYINPDYSKRLKGQMLLAILEGLSD